MLYVFHKHNYPVFDRTDTPAFRVEKVEITRDTTCVHCSYYAEDHSWANISKSTRIEDVPNGMRFPILKVSGIPFSPEKRNFEDPTRINVLLYFPHVNSEKINIIENDDNESFNIYGINLKKSFNCIYTEEELEYSFRMAKKEEELGNLKLAIDNFQKQLDASKFLYGKRSKECAWAMFNMLLDYGELKKWDECIEQGNAVIDILSDYPQDSLVVDVLARTYESLSTIYYILKKEDVASQYKDISISLRKKKEGVGAIPYEQFLKDATLKYYYDEEYSKALLYGKELVDILEKKYNENNGYGCDYVNALCNLCEYYQRMYQPEEAIKYVKKAQGLIENGVCDWARYYVYQGLAGAMAQLGKVDEAVSLLKEVIAACESKEDEDLRLSLNSRMFLSDILLKNKQKNDTINAINEYEKILKIREDSISAGVPFYFPEYRDVLHKLYEIYVGRNDSISSQYLNKEIQIIKEGKGDGSIAYANLLIEYIHRIVGFSFLREEKGQDSIFTLLKEASGIIKRHINNSIYNISKNERERYWQRYKMFFTWLIPSFCGLSELDAASSLAYDTSLFYKGMLLSSEREFREAILSSKDSVVNNVYSNYIHNLSLIEKYWEEPSWSLNIDSLKSIIKDEEYLLSQRITSFNRVYKGTNFSWEEVKQRLGDSDVAIEFVSYVGIDNSNTYYDAYIISKRLKTPKKAFLFNEKWLEDFSQEDSIKNALSSWIWGNDIVYEAIKDAKNIYFSPSGLLNSIGIEYLPISGGQYMNERFNMVRLSSTRELCLLGEKKPIKDVCLYGGLDYNEQKEENVFNKTDTIRLTRSVVDSIEKRGGFEPLTGSKEEVEQIYKEIIGKGIKCRAYTGSVGTESNLKQLSGNDIDIIHLSTHGMYVPIEEADTNKTNYSFVISDNAINIDEEDQSLTHSFIVMSGGNLLIKDKNKQSEKDDGILTALEVSRLDFSNLDLVVLSACQTALGKVESEGVYGLQRGFKKAGANTILMSLDKVDDEATKMLMVEFYKNLMSGKTKHQSFKDAQKYLRQVDNGKYDKPEYWASFIMLDGLD